MYRENINILGRNIKRAESKTIELEVAKLHTRNSVKIPIIIERSKTDGPVLLFMAGIHGDEINGVEIVRRIIHKKINKPEIGTVVCIPVFNIFGFLNLSREFPDGRDLNRLFPGSSNGSLASQFAFQFMKSIIPDIDYVVDYHTGSADRFNAPQVRCDLNDEHTVEFAKSFAAPFLVQSKYIAKSLRAILNKMGKTALLYEGGKSKSFDEEIIECGVQGAINVMRFLKMQKNNITDHRESVIIEKSKWLRAPYSGMFHSKIKNGEWIKAKTIIGIVTDPYGEFEKKISAPFDCYIFCVNTSPIVNRGDAIFHISINKKK